MTLVYYHFNCSLLFCTAVYINRIGYFLYCVLLWRNSFFLYLQVLFSCFLLNLNNNSFARYTSWVLFFSPPSNVLWSFKGFTSWRIECISSVYFPFSFTISILFFLSLPKLVFFLLLTYSTQVLSCSNLLIYSLISFIQDLFSCIIPSKFRIQHLVTEGNTP